jgi:hypothetical protein
LGLTEKWLERPAPGQMMKTCNIFWWVTGKISKLGIHWWIFILAVSSPYYICDMEIYNGRRISVSFWILSEMIHNQHLNFFFWLLSLSTCGVYIC